jgi:hypothetical protein
MHPSEAELYWSTNLGASNTKAAAALATKQAADSHTPNSLKKAQRAEGGRPPW